MNIKKILSLTFCFVLLVGAVFSFSSCNKKKEACDHTFAAEWSTDATNHWHAATCEHKEETKDVAPHVDANADEKCDVCAYAMPAQEKPGDTGNNPVQKPDDKPAEPETPALTGKTQVTYTVTVVNAAGEPLAGAKVKLLDKEGLSYGDGIPAKDTDAEGKVTFTVLYKSGWKAQVVAAPEGYTLEKSLDEETNFDFIDQYEFDEEFNLTITLPEAPADENPVDPPVGDEDDGIVDDGTGTGENNGTGENTGTGENNGSSDENTNTDGTGDVTE